jgi:hypothetical protein
MTSYQAVRLPLKDFVIHLVSQAQLLAATNEEHLKKNEARIHYK